MSEFPFVAYSPDSADIFRLWINLANFRRMRLICSVTVSRIAQRIHPPDAIIDELAGKNLARMQDEQLNDLEFLWASGAVPRRHSAPHAPANRRSVDHSVAGPPSLARSRRCPRRSRRRCASTRASSSLDTERLHHVVVRADAKPLNLVGIALLGAEKENGDIQIVAQLPADREAIAARQHDVEDDLDQDDVRARHAAPARHQTRPHRVALIFEGILNKLDNVLLVVDNQNRPARFDPVSLPRAALRPDCLPTRAPLSATAHRASPVCHTPNC